MSSNWIKMRPGLLTNPKVNGIARHIENNADACKVLSTGYSGVMSEIVTRNVTRYVTVTALLLVWGAANEHTSNGVFVNADLSDIDDIAGIPGFGEAMLSVGWLIQDEDSFTVTLPNFDEYNTSTRERGATAKTNAERQREYRERKKQEQNRNENVATNNVTSDVTRDRREDKKREDKSKEEKTSKKEPAARAASLSVSDLVSEGVDLQTATEFLAIRKRKRSPLTELAMRGIRREAGKAGWPVEDALKKCIERGWQSFEAEWVSQSRQGSGLNRQEALEARNQAIVDDLMRTAI